MREVDGNAYGGSSMAAGCRGCESDVIRMRNILTPLGYDVVELMTREATHDAILGALDRAAGSLAPGDTLVFYFSGHGKQMPDTDDNPPETDHKDESLCAYDGIVLDDELGVRWPAFQGGVRIISVCDCCRSGTVFRLPLQLTLNRASRRPTGRPRSNDTIRAQLIHLGSSTDDVDSHEMPDGSGSIFTTMLWQVLTAGSFIGNYRDLVDEINGMTNWQTAVYVEQGPVSQAFRDARPSVGVSAPG